MEIVKAWTYGYSLGVSNLFLGVVIYTTIFLVSIVQLDRTAN